MELIINWFRPTTDHLTMIFWTFYTQNVFTLSTQNKNLSVFDHISSGATQLLHQDVYEI